MKYFYQSKTLTATSLMVMASLFYACNDNFLDTTPLDKISSSVTWSDGTLAEAFVFSVYSYLGYGGFEEQMLAVYTDEAMFTHAGRNIKVIPTNGVQCFQRYVKQM
jgi:hypothetical protein